MTSGRSALLPTLLLIDCFLWIAGASAAPARISGAPLVYLRSEAAPTASPLAVLSEGDTVETIASDGNWTKVQARNGKTGYVYSSFVEELDVPAAEAAVPSEASPEPAPNPSPVAPAAPMAESERNELISEVGQLRSEIAELKQQLVDRLPESPPSEPPVTVVTPESDSAAAGGNDTGVRMLAIAFVSVALGWVLGTLFARRRNRSQRSRLRF